MFVLFDTEELPKKFSDHLNLLSRTIANTSAHEVLPAVMYA
jgi:hypothetical protein